MLNVEKGWCMNIVVVALAVVVRKSCH